MDLIPIIDKLGGGPAAVAIAVLGLVVWKLWNRINEVQDRELLSAREFAKDLASIANDNGDKIESLTRLLEVKRNV